MFYNHENRRTDCSDITPRKAYDVFNQLIKSVGDGKELRETDFGWVFYVLNKVQENWSVYYPYRELMCKYYELFKLARNGGTFDSGAIYGSLGISRKFLNDYLGRHHRRVKLEIKALEDASIPNKIRRPGLRYHLMAYVKGHGRYSSLGEGRLVDPLYGYCLCRR